MLETVISHEQAPICIKEQVTVLGDTVHTLQQIMVCVWRKDQGVP